MSCGIRVSVYIDGFNLFHSLDELGRPHLKWLDLWSLSKSLLRPDDHLTQVNYYTAYATWLPQAYATHRSYVKALQAVDVNIVLGKFKGKHVKCRECHKVFTTKEEKKTDINIALGLVVDGLQNKYDRAILISADTDLVSAVNEARRLSPHKEVFVAVPQNRFKMSHEFGKRYAITPARFGKNLLASQYTDVKGNLIVRRPAKYNPPHNPA